jgi:V/A-type H+-transporting ATPase subunit D
MEDVSPTRTELLTKKSQIRLSRQGAGLLRGKREALVREFLEEIKSFRSDREEMLKALNEAAQSLMQALALDGQESVRSVGLATRNAVEVELKEQNIWGTKVVDVETEYRPRMLTERDYSPLSTSSRINDSVDNFETAVERIIRVAPRFHKLGRLAEEIRKTSRRVNALEQRLLPSLEQQVSYIQTVLDQREREDIFRLKRIKRSKSM